MTYPKVAVTGCAILLATVAGCGKIPTWGELTGQAQPAPPTQPVPANVAPVVPVNPVAPPAAPSASDVISRFNSLGKSQKSDADLQSLTSLKEGLDAITEIDATGSPITSAGMANIERLTGLRVLRLNRTRMDDEACRRIAALPSLEVLTLAETQVTDVGVAAISALQNLQELELTRVILSENAFRAIGNLPSLRKVSIESTNLNNRSLELLCNAKTITDLTLATNPINDFGLVALGKLESLEYLEISHTQFTGEAFGKLTKGGGLKRLKHLGMCGCPINDKGAKAISTAKSIESLNFCQISTMNDAGLDHIIKGMKNLRYMNLANNPVLEGWGLRTLKNSSSIEEIHLDGCPKIGDPVIQILKTAKNLKKVGLGGTAVSPRGLSELQAALPEAKLH